jgi:hypothetical protein
MAGDIQLQFIFGDARLCAALPCLSHPRTNQSHSTVFIETCRSTVSMARCPGNGELSTVSLTCECHPYRRDCGYECFLYGTYLQALPEFFPTAGSYMGTPSAAPFLQNGLHAPTWRSCESLNAIVSVPRLVLRSRQFLLLVCAFAFGTNFCRTKYLFCAKPEPVSQNLRH